jgi:DNA-binding transcriptional LysR family regulator
MDRIRQLEIFTAAADRQSFSGAARALAISPAAVSAGISALEESWRVRLFDRTTRAVRLTDAGRELLDRARRILRELEAAEAVAASDATLVRGAIKISAPVSYGIKVLGPLLAEFLDQNPEVRVKLDLTDRRIDLLAEGYDLAVRVGHQIAAGLLARKIAQQRLVLCAAPVYLERYGTPIVPEDLTTHNCLVFTPRTPVGRWSFVSPTGARRIVSVAGSLQSDNGELLAIAAGAGAGITLAPDFLVQDDLERGALVELMPQWRSLRLGVFTVRIGGGKPPLRVGRLTEFLRGRLRAEHTLA